MTEEWSDLLEYSQAMVQATVSPKPGVYRLSALGDEGKFFVFYVGQAVDLRARLLQHLGPEEQNSCIKTKRSKACKFRILYVESQKDRDLIESKQVEEYRPECNKQKP